MQLKDKETGDLYVLAVGKILSPKEVKKKNITASFVSLRSAVSSPTGEDVFVSAIIGYTKEGFYSDMNKFELIYEEGEK
jgi:hypothetical protein